MPAGHPLRAQMQVVLVGEGHVGGGHAGREVRTRSYDSRWYSAVIAARTVSRCGKPCSTGLPLATSAPPVTPCNRLPL